MPSKIEIALALSDKALIAIFIVVVIIGALLVTGIINFLTAALIGAAMAVIFAVVVSKIVKAQLTQPKVGAEALIGKRGKVITPLNPEGMIMVEGEYWKAMSQQPIEDGEEVEVVCAEGLMLKVKRVGAESKSCN